MGNPHTAPRGDREIEEPVSTSYFPAMFDFAASWKQSVSAWVGDIPVVYSDGLTDAENHESERNPAEVPVRVFWGILGRLRNSPAGPQNDDIMFLVARKSAKKCFGKASDGPRPES